MSTDEVNAYLAASAHGRTREIEAIRAAILAAEPALAEQVKWNAPSFSIDGHDRITFRLHPGDRVQLIFHRGARTLHDPANLTNIDPDGVARWVTDDRGIVTFRDASDVAARLPDVVALVSRWICATR